MSTRDEFFRYEAGLTFSVVSPSENIVLDSTRGGVLDALEKGLKSAVQEWAKAQNVATSSPILSVAYSPDPSHGVLSELLDACLEADEYYPSEAAPLYMERIRAAIAKVKGGAA